MALTVEELQIVLSCDATTAQQVLDKMDATVKAYTNKFQKYFQTKAGNVKPLDAVAKSVDSAADRIEGAAKRVKKAYQDFTPKYNVTGATYKDIAAKIRAGVEDSAGKYDPNYFYNSDAYKMTFGSGGDPFGAVKQSAEEATESMSSPIYSFVMKSTDALIRVGGVIKQVFSSGCEVAKTSVVGIGAGLKAVAGAARNVGSAIKKAFSHTLLGKFVKRLGSVMMRMAAMKLIRGIIQGVQQGLEELAKQSESSAKAMNQIKAAGGSIKMALGAAVMPIVKALAPIFYNLASAINSACDAIARFFVVLTGQGTYTPTKFSGSLDRVSSSAGGAGKAVKRAIAAFDELNVIGNQGGGGGGGGVTSSFSDVGDDVEAFSELASKIREQILKGDWAGVGAAIAEELNGTIEKNLDGRAGAALAQKISNFFKNVLDLCSGFLETLDWMGLGRGIVNTITEFFTNIDYSGVTQSIFRFLGAALGAVSGLLVGALAQLVENMVADLNHAIEWANSFESVGDFIVNGILMGIVNGLVNIYNWIRDNVFTPFINGFKKAFGIASPAKEMEEPGKMVGEGILAGIAKPFKAIGTWLNDHIVQPIKDFFTNNREAWDNTEIPFAEPLTNFTDMLQSAAQKFTAFANIIEATLGLGGEYISAFFITLIDYISTRGDLIKLNVQKFVLNLKATVLEGLAGLVDSLANGAVGRLLDLIGVDLGGAAQNLRDKAAQARDSVGEIDTKIADAQEKAKQGFNISANVDSSKVDAYKQTLNRGLSATVTLSCNADALKTAMRNALTTTVNVTYRNSSGTTSNAGTIRSTPSLAAANGAIAYGMTTALIGEYGGAKSNPEVVAPLSTLVGLLNKSDIGGADSKATAEQNRLLEEQNRLLRVIAKKELKLSPSAELGQVVSRSSQLYART